MAKEQKSEQPKKADKKTKEDVKQTASVRTNNSNVSYDYVIKYPLSTEKSLKSTEFENKMTFIVDLKASKALIKKAIEHKFNAKVNSINTVITLEGIKKAYVKFDKGVNAIDIATNLGMI